MLAISKELFKHHTLQMITMMILSRLDHYENIATFKTVNFHLNSFVRFHLSYIIGDSALTTKPEILTSSEQRTPAAPTTSGHRREQRPASEDYRNNPAISRSLEGLSECKATELIVSRKH